uniref:VWFA domain-containing protein n=1 Tax=Gadus morhua TaxID=8049 RepID=A0A8C5F6H0_GADMO
MAEIRSLLFVALMASVCLHGHAAQLTDTLSSQKCTETSLADIVFLLDGSSSISAKSFKEMLLFLQKFIQNLDVGADKVRVGVAQYSDEPYEEFLLKDHMDEASLLEQVSKIQHRNGGTFTGKAMTFLQQTFFTPEGGSRAAQRVPQIAVVITDGDSSDDVIEPARQLRQKGVIVFAIDIGSSNSTNMHQIANRPHERFLFSITSYQALQQLLDRLLQILCVTVEDQRAVLLFPQKCNETSLADIVFLLDGSSSISPESFKEMLLFLQKFIQNLDVGADKVRVGVAQYSDEPYKEFLLKDHMDEALLLDQVSKIEHRKGGTFTGQAITFLQQTFFTPEGGSRAAEGVGVPQIAVVITDGGSSDDVIEPARQLRQKGVIVFAIDIGRSNSTNLHEIANRPHERFLFSINSYQALQQLLDRLLQILCVTVEDQRAALVPKFSDIYFLVDSGLTAADFKLTQNMMVRVVQQLNVGDGAHRIGLARYGQETKSEFLPKKFKNKKEVVARIKGLKVIKGSPNAPRNLGGALNYAVDNFFSTEAGSREHLGFRQFLVVASGANSSDSIYQPARRVKSEGVTVMGIGLGPGMTDQMKTVASAPYVYQSANIVPMLKAAFETEEEHMGVVEDCVASRVADVVFIVDESERIEAADFQLVLSFLHNMVESLDVQTNRVRVGIVTYSDNPAVQVYLDTFDNKNEILQFIKMLHYHGGGNKTGLALKFARENVFVKQRGGRKSQGVQQVAVVITYGKSQDEVEKEAADLRRDGVTIYAIGIKDADETQLVQIASHPSTKHVYNVDSFVRLKTLQKSLEKTMCHNIFRQAIAVNERRTDIKEGCMQTDEADIFFLIDQSGSIQPDDFNHMKKFVIDFLNTYHIGPDHIRVGCVKYADSPTLEFDLTTYTDSKTLENAVERIVHVGGGTETGRGLSFMAPLFERAMKTRGHKVPEHLIVITDGKSMDKVQLPAEELRTKGVNIYAIGVKEAVETELRKIAGSPQNTFLVNNFDALKIIKDDIITEICSADACKDIPRDLLFLIDSSGSIRSDEYQKMKDFMKAMIGKSQIEKEIVHVGVMQFSTSQTMVFQLNDFHDKGEMLKAIDKMQQLGGGTHTGQALTEVSLYFDLAKGGRPGKRQNLIMITDGESQDQVKGPAEVLRQKGVTIFSIGVVNANTTQLLEISGSDDHVFTQRNFDALKDLERELNLRLCERECQKTQMADIIFLVDGSTSISVGNFSAMLNFMQSVVNLTTVGEKMTRFGVILYSNETESKFNLKEYFSKSEVLKAIQALKSPTGNTYTGKALNYTLQFFDEKYGGRQAAEVPQILMVITDGEATDRHDLKAPSEALREKGISVFSIGVKGADKTELVIMAGEPSRVFFVDNFDALKTLYKNVSSELCSTTIPGCKKEKADLVLLVDTSETISDNAFSNMTTFMTDLIGSFKISKDQVRVGLAQFSSNTKKEFYLNQFHTVEEVTKNILDMVRQKEGTKIGKALDFIKSYFEASTGSRISSRVSQNLVVMMDDGSLDDPVQEAEVLRGMGIRIFVIGVGVFNKLDLKKITADTDLIFTVQDFGALAKIKQKVVETICEKPACSIDVAIGFDMSQRSGSQLLVSGFPKLRAALPEILHHVSTLKGLCCVQNMPIEPNVAFRLVSHDGRVLDDFNFEPFSEAVVDKVMNVQMSEDTFFNTALLTSFQEKFKTQSNAGAKVLVVFTDGLDEDVMKLEHQSELLRLSGVNALLAVALDGVRDSSQIQMVEFGRGFGYKVPLSVGMQSVGSTLLKQIDAVAERECCGVMCKCSGHEGSRGLRGSSAAKGVPGPNGHPGFPGEEGTAGDRGHPGPSGVRGNQGCPGTRGQKGNRGHRGDKGEEGDLGMDGVDGQQGEAGLKGALGDRGRPGNAGNTGIRGEGGDEGQRGLRGDPGAAGSDNAEVGPKGEPGNAGMPVRNLLLGTIFSVTVFLSRFGTFLRS